MAISTYWADKYVENKRRAAEVLNLIKPGQRVFIGSSCGEPQYLVRALSEAAGYLSVSGMGKVASEPVLESDIRHLCLRMAWHDNKWDGNICRDPSSNIYCIGDVLISFHLNITDMV